MQRAYPEFELPSQSDVNVIEISANNLFVANLKAAISEAKTTTQGDVIVVRTTDSANKIKFASSADEIKIAVDPTKYGGITIVALGSKPLTIDAAQKSRVVRVDKSVVELGNLTITNGKLSGSRYKYGAGIYNDAGTVGAADCTITKNSAVGAYDGGGGIGNDGGTFTTVNCVIGDNSADRDGGGIYSYGSGAIFTAINCEVFKNSAQKGRV